MNYFKYISICLDELLRNLEFLSRDKQITSIFAAYYNFIKK